MFDRIEATAKILLISRLFCRWKHKVKKERKKEIEINAKWRAALNSNEE